MAKLARPRPVFLITDYGTRDTYAGQLRAVIAALAPNCPVHDLTHDVTPFAVEEGAWLLETALPVLPDNAVVVAVVDPGVGSERRAILVEAGGRVLVGPDNGLLSGAFSPALRAPATLGAGACPPGGGPEPRVRELTDPRFWRAQLSATFHGRDLFAPAAAHLASGVDVRLFGPPIADPVLLPPFCAEPEADGSLSARVVHVDRFGNAITSVLATQLFPGFDLAIGECTIGRCLRTFSDAPPGEPFCHVDSSGYVAVAVSYGSAASALGVRPGDPVRVTRR